MGNRGHLFLLPAQGEWAVTKNTWFCVEVGSFRAINDEKDMFLRSDSSVN